MRGREEKRWRGEEGEMRGREEERIRGRRRGGEDELMWSRKSREEIRGKVERAGGPEE